MHSGDSTSVPLGDLGILERGKSKHRPRYAPHLYGGTYPFIQTGDIKSSNGRVTSFTQTYSEAGLNQSRLWDAGTLCITIAANIGETAILTFPACFPDSVVGFIAHENLAHTPYIAYALLHLRSRMQSDASGSVQDNINLEYLRNLRVPIFPLESQKAIAQILGTLDDKIELNRKMNETLEEIAKAIFKSWFVDFDPVRAKAEGRPTGLPAEISDLFPDTFEDTELGQIPSGWAHRSLGVLVTPQRGKTITKSKCVEGGVPVVAGGLAPAYYHNVANVSAPVVTVSASGANAGFARIYHEDIWASDCSYISKRQSRFVYIWYIFLKMNQSRIYHMQQGAAQPHIYPSDLMRMEVVCPEDEILWRHLDTIVSPMFERISICYKQNKVLVDLRDTLLPRLISGELRIPDAEKFLAEAGI
jgi:type I restriction enzyme, S subunit